MRLPIQYALMHPERVLGPTAGSLVELGSWQFEQSYQRLSALDWDLAAERRHLRAVLNAAMKLRLPIPANELPF